MAAPSEPSSLELKGYTFFRQHLHEHLRLRCEVSWERRLPGIYGSDWSVSVVDAGGSQALYGTGRAQVGAVDDAVGYVVWNADAERVTFSTRPFLLTGEQNSRTSQTLRHPDQLLAHSTRQVALAQIDQYAMTWRTLGFEARRMRYWSAISPVILWLQQAGEAGDSEMKVSTSAVEAAIRKRWAEMISGERRKKLLADAEWNSRRASRISDDRDPFWYDDRIPDIRG